MIPINLLNIKKSGWIKPGRLNDKNLIRKYTNMSTKDLYSDDYYEEENYR